jgi:uncharacterized membrane protein
MVGDRPARDQSGEQVLDVGEVQESLSGRHVDVSADQVRFGACGRKSGSTGSGGTRGPGSRTVVRRRWRGRTPEIPAAPISRFKRLRPTRTPCSHLTPAASPPLLGASPSRGADRERLEGAAWTTSKQASPVSSRWETSRTEAFSDGVFAIAITLLVLDISVPETAFDDLWRGIGHQWPAYLGYATSFLTIGGIWLAHHAIFRRLQYANAAVMRLNLLLLMAVAFLPFPTRLVAEAIHKNDAERAAVVFYGISLFVIHALVSALWGAIVRDRELLKPDVSDQEVNAITLAATPNTALFVGAIVLAIIVPKVAAFGYLVIAVVGVFRARGDQTSATAPKPRTTRIDSRRDFQRGCSPDRGLGGVHIAIVEAFRLCEPRTPGQPIQRVC